MTAPVSYESSAHGCRTKTVRGQFDENRARVLRLVLSIGETSAPYNQFSLGLRDKQNITICTYFKSIITPPKEITLFDGDNTLKGFHRALRRALAAGRYDVVHAHTPHVGLFYLLATMGQRNQTKPASVYTVHSTFRNYTRLRTKLMLLPVFMCFRKVVCCSHASAASIPAVYKWLAGDRVCVVPNGLDIDRIDRAAGNSRRPIRQNTHFTVVAVGRLIKIKNPLTVLNAFRQSAAPASRLILVGDGTLRERIGRTCKAYNLANHVELTGLIRREEVYGYLANADLFMSTSSVEGLPISVLEAMTCRCPVVLSDIPAHREIADGVDFIPLIPADDVTGFAQEIKRFKQMSACERAKIGEECRKLVEDRFSLATMYRKYSDVYREVIGQSHLQADAIA